MKAVKSSANQALLYSHLLDAWCPGAGISFTRRWSMGAVDPRVDTLPGKTFEEFCIENPDEPTFIAPDGTVRKQHYGAPGTEQPWDVWKRRGWAAAAAAGNVIKYLRRTKDPEDVEDAKWYFRELMKLVNAGEEVDTDDFTAYHVARSLLEELTREEMDVLGVPACFRLKE